MDLPDRFNVTLTDADYQKALRWLHDAREFTRLFDIGVPVSPRLVTFTKIA